MKRILATLLAVAAILLPCSNVSNASQTEVKVYERLNIDHDRMVVLKDTVLSRSTDPIVNKLYQLDKESDEPIWFILNTPGGSVPAGWRLASAMRAVKSPIWCVVDTKAYSMGAVLLQYCDYRIIQEYADVMFHEVSFRVGGTYSFIMSFIDHMNDYIQMFDKEVADRLDLNLKEYKDKSTFEWWLTSREAVREGVADAIVKDLIYFYEEPQSTDLFLTFKRNTAWLCGPDPTDKDDVCNKNYKGIRNN